NAELVFFFADSETRKIALDEECGDSLVSVIGIPIRKHDEQVRLNRIRDPKLAAIEQEVVAVVYSAASEGKCVAAGAGFGQCTGADEVLRQAWQILAFLLIVVPAHESVVHERVLHIDKDAERGIHSGAFLDGEHRQEEAAPTP